MEVSVQKCESPDFPKKSRSVDLKSVYAEKPRGLERKSSVHKSSKESKRHNSPTFELRRSLSDGPRRKRSRKEASLSSFGPAITKKRRNGLNSLTLKPNGFSSGVGKPEKPRDSSSMSDGLCSFSSDAALDILKRNDSGTPSIGNCGSSSGLSDGVIIPKKPRCVLRQRKLNKIDDTTKAKEEDHRSAKTGAGLSVNDLSTDVASSSQVLEGQRKKESIEVKNELTLDVTSPSQVSDDKGKKECTDRKDELSTPVALLSQVSDGKRKMKSTNVKNKPSTDLASPSQVSDGKKKKKPSDIRDEFPADLLSPSHVSVVKRKKKSADVRNELSADVVSPSQVSVVKWKKKPNDVKEKGSGRDSSVLNIKGEKIRRRRKKNSTALVREDHLENGTPLTDNGEELYGDLLEDDLEQNAARMLSSRFDPSCTGISGNRAPSSKPASASHGNFDASQPESSSIDAVGRMLRPRRRNGKSLVRKRRHFYEINYRDMDPYCLLKQRIRVFWPLDQSWYFGLVKDYDPVTRLHHVKYDDRDEEWINLQNERFKLLLFPSEIAGKFDSGRSRLELKQEEGDEKSLDDSVSNCTESEPIIAWLTRSKHHRKLSAANLIKKRRTHHLKDFESSIPLKLQGHSKLFPKPEEASPDTTVGKSSPSVNDRELSFVYFRKKFHKRKEGLDKTLEHDSVHGRAASINILASVADSAAVLEELDIFDSSMELKQVILKLSFCGLCIHDLAFGLDGSLCRALFHIQFGKLTNVWPMVHMEIVLVDNVLGLRLLLFEGSLRCAAALLCLIISSFCQPSKGSKFEDVQMPFTSIGINLSGLHDHGGKLLFLLYRFLEVKSSKWRYVEDKLKRQCMRVREIPVRECTSSAIKNLQNESGRMLCSSVSNSAVSFQDFPERSYSDILHQFITDKTVHLNINPTVCYIDENRGRLPPPSLSFATAPLSILSLHIKLLMERSAACVGFQKHASSSYQESPDGHDKSTVHGCSPVEDASDQVSDITMENLGSSLSQAAASSGKQSVGHLKVDTDALSVSNDGDWMRSSHNSLRNEVNISENSVGHRDMELNGSNETVGQIERFQSHARLWQDGEKSSSSFPEGYSSPEKSGGYNSYMNNTNVHPQSVGQAEQSIEKGTLAAETALDLAWEMNGYSSLNPTAPRSVRNCNGHNSVSPKCGHYSKLWQEDFMWNGFNSGSKKPRTHVSYSLPFGGFDLGSKRRSHQRKPRCYKKITTDNAKKLLGVSANSHSYHQRLTCNGNVLVTDEDKGWRECGAEVVIESDDHKDSRICVKFSGVTKYQYKAQHVLQPGITNRHTHAMMWKVGKDWTLEFTDRNQWSVFKELHEECFNRNIRAAYVKNIPIPGVRLIADDDDDDVVGMPFARSSSKYYRQVGTEVDMALDPAHMLYDMDSDDEEWVSKMRNSMDIKGDGISEITDDVFERVMDIFEKFACAQQCDEFSSDEIEEFMVDVGPLDIVRTIYEYWRQKRLKKDMPLIRQFQPALWVRYQQQLKEWESATSKMLSLPDGSREKEFLNKKPPMYAFCLRPRGLEVPNKLLKQRSHKKFISTMSHSSFGREQDGFYSSGRRTNGLGDERALVCIPIPCYESSDSYHSNDGPESFQYPELHMSNSKKRGSFSSPRDSQITPFSHNNKPKKNGMDPWGPGMLEPPSMSQIQRDGLRRHRADIDEFKLRDASSAAQHASKMAKMKREKAQWLIHKTDLAIHKATVALMIAQAMKESKEDLMDEDEGDDDDVDDI